MASRVRSPKSKSPEVRLFTRTPSISTCTWVGFAPRMRIVESFRGCPTSGPERRGRSGAPRPPRGTPGLASPPPGTTVTEAPVCSIRCSNRSAVTTTGSARRTPRPPGSPARCPGAGWAVSWPSARAPIRATVSIASTHHSASTLHRALLIREGVSVSRAPIGLLTRGSSRPPRLPRANGPSDVARRAPAAVRRSPLSCRDSAGLGAD